MASTIQVRVEDELKNKSDALFKDLATEERAEIIDSYQPDIDEIKERIAELKEELENI